MATEAVSRISRHQRIAKQFAAALPKARIARHGQERTGSLTIEVDLDRRRAVTRAIRDLAAAVSEARPALYVVLPALRGAARSTVAVGAGRALRMTSWYDIRRDTIRTHVDVAFT